MQRIYNLVNMLSGNIPEQLPGCYTIWNKKYVRSYSVYIALSLIGVKRTLGFHKAINKPSHNSSCNMWFPLWIVFMHVYFSHFMLLQYLLHALPICEYVCKWKISYSLMFTNSHLFRRNTQLLKMSQSIKLSDTQFKRPIPNWIKKAWVFTQLTLKLICFSVILH